ncbi:MAG: ribosome maturation factor RimM [Bacteroidales bacterium]|jgi:16S rRNA processing protein RimM|nr:ribosome maturation factor RimM [Bacteroidales bacterium]HOI31775.1 ribosome maturation factor RimM [Bacteroidales bacterium]
MNKEDCFYFGKVIKTHGLEGELSIRIDADDPMAYTTIEFLLVEKNKKLIPFYLKAFRLLNNKAYVAFEDINHIDEARNFTGSLLYLPLKFLPTLSGNKFYFHEVEGFTVTDQVFGEIGQIKTVLEYPNQALLQVFHGEKEVLIPIQDEIILEVNRKKKHLLIDAPEGLIEMYLNN